MKNSDLIIRRKKRALQRKLRNIITVAFVVISIVTIVALASVGAAQAEETVSLNKYYRSVTIMPNDNLWSIAVENTGGSRAEVQEFITEVEKINKIDADHLDIGMKIIIPYYK